MDISFYAVRNTSIEKTLPKLVEKIYDAGLHVHILCNDDDFLKTLDASLWTFASMAFLPHGTPYDPPHIQPENPIFLSTTMDLKNKPEVLILLTPFLPDKDWAFKRVIYFYDVNAQNNKDFESLYNACQKTFEKPIFWEQTPEGGWAKKSN